MIMPDQAILVTGAAGFIGFHVAQRLLQSGHRVVGIDNLNGYYDPRLKAARLDILRNDPRFEFEKLDVADRSAIPALFARHRFPVVIHLAWSASPIFWRAAGTMAAVTCCSRPRHPSTEPTGSCRSRCTTTSIIRSASMP